jgi:hypothetical protein
MLVEHEHRNVSVLLGGFNANVAILWNYMVKISNFWLNFPPKKALFSEERKGQSYSNAPLWLIQYTPL